ncbi:MAG: NfeD family protein, partial [Leptospiraceae bacterium]|nr:NfeD family protein [Leptospiraceae bacterium]
DGKNFSFQNISLSARWRKGTKMEYLETIYFYMAVSGTIFFFIKFALSFFGHDSDLHDVDAFDPDNLDFKFLSLQTISIFSAGFGWMGLFIFKNTGLGVNTSFALAFVFGILSAAFEIWIFTKVKGLAQINELNLSNAIGKIGKVYLTIPENSVGEIQVSFQGSMKNIKAVSLSGEKIPAFTEIKVSSVRDGILVVETL